MSFDHIIKFIWLTNYFEKFPRPSGEDFKMERYFEHIENSKELTVILPFWKSGLNDTKFLSWRARRSGKSCLFYASSPELLSADPDHTLQEFRRIKARVCDDIFELKKYYGFSRVKLVAASLGVVSAMMVANGNDDIDELVLVAPGSCLASSLWDGIRTQKLRKIYEQQGVNLESLQELWKELAPKNNIDLLENKKIYMSLSKSDKLIPYNYGKELADLLAEKGAQVAENRFWGHYISIANFYLFGKL